jgi:hypothetical protein
MILWAEDQPPPSRSPVEERELQCPACGYTWWADGREEYGAWWPVNEDDLYCGRCGCEGET